jgi:shikimate kinase
MKSNIVLIGFMATGKSAAGRLLAERLDKQPVELDVYIEKKAGKIIPEIFAQDGEAAFRQLETEAVAEVAANDSQVIACGGGVVLNLENIDRLKENGIVICLTAAPEVILQRVSADETVRPLLANENRDQAIRELLAARQPLYQQAADIMLDTSELDVNGVVEQIIAGLEEYAGNDK